MNFALNPNFLFIIRSMGVEAGTRVGPYEIIGLIGAGGMGEVYRARDERLSRDVAIKILPAHFTQDAERLRRFEQEARAVGMLNHPNIVHVHDIGNFEGVPYVVSELLEGETLRSRLHSGAIPYRKSIDYALQIARGLSEAHEKGIIHRDLKPENIFITRDGRIKILDFGLAKLTQVSAIRTNQSSLSTEGGTEAGMVLGTVGYMSPEQVRGLLLDHRSDIFAFGAIFYEMLTGNRAFRGDSTVETMNAILKQEPEGLPGSLSGIPPAIEKILTHCLEKNTGDRFHSASDLAFALETISNFSASTTAVPVPSRRFRSIVLALIALPLVLLALWGITTFLFKPVDQPNPSFQRLTFRRGTVFNSRFASDGQTVVYGAAWEGQPSEIFQTRKDSYESRSLDIPDADVLSISKSDELLILLRRRFLIGYMSQGTLARVPLTGGAPREFLENVSDADWHPETSEIAAVVALRRLEFPIGKLLYESDGWISQIRFSPDGKRIAFTNHPRVGDNAGLVSVYDLTSGKSTDVTGRLAALNGISWTPDGKELWYSGHDRSGNRYQLYSTDRQGNHRQITSSPGHILLYDISTQGQVLLSLFDPRRGVVAFPEGAEKGIDLSWFEWSFGTDLSDDGKLLLITEMGEGAGDAYAIYLRKTDGSPAIRLGSGWGLSLSPDHKHVVAISYPHNEKMYLLPTGAGEIRDLHKHSELYDWVTFTNRPDEVIYSGRSGKRSTGLFLQNVHSGAVRRITDDQVGLPYVISQDGRLVAATDLSGTTQIYPVEQGQGEKRTVDVPGYFPVQFAEDNSFLYLAKFSGVADIVKYELSTGKTTFWKNIKPDDPAGVGQLGPIQITPDGKTYAYSYRRQLTDLYLATDLK